METLLAYHSTEELGIREHARVRMNYDVTEQGITQNNDKENTIQYIGEFSAHLLIKLYCTHCPKNNLNLCKKNTVCHGWNGFHDGRYLFTYCISGPETGHIPLHLFHL